MMCNVSVITGEIGCQLANEKVRFCQDGQGRNRCVLERHHIPALDELVKRVWRIKWAVHKRLRRLSVTAQVLFKRI